jgi:hypothetical protein
MAPAPAADAFPLLPASWYLLGTSAQLRGQPLRRTVRGRLLVAARTPAGCPTVRDAHGTYPAQLRHGLLFFFNGLRPLFPLPFFLGERPHDFRAGRPFRFVADCPWYLLAANGFDLEHFRCVHDRTLVGEGQVDCPAPFARRMRYTARVTGTSVFDVLIRQFLGDTVRVSITSWGGPFITVTGQFRRACSYILIATQPLDDERTLAEVIVFARRGWLAPVGLWVRRLFTRAFMQDDIDLLGGVRYNPHTLIAADRPMIEFFQWLAALPQGPVVQRSDLLACNSAPALLSSFTTPPS